MQVDTSKWPIVYVVDHIPADRGSGHYGRTRMVKYDMNKTALAFYRDFNVALLHDWGLGPKTTMQIDITKHQMILECARSLGMSHAGATQFCAMAFTNWPQLMEDEDTQIGLDPTPAPTPVEQCKYAQMVLTTPGSEIDSDSAYNFASIKHDHRRTLQRVLRAWPTCPYGGEVSLEYRRKSAGAYDIHGMWRMDNNLVAVFYCADCAKKGMVTEGLIYKEE